MRGEERDALRKRFQFRCGYCSVSEHDVGSELTVDHFQPLSRNGSDGPENWVYSCHACNEFKGDWWQPSVTNRILHPLRDDLYLHILEQEDGMLRAITEIGAFHIARLHLNRSQLVIYRLTKRRLQSAASLQETMLQRLSVLEAEVRALTTQLEELGRSHQGAG